MLEVTNTPADVIASPPNWPEGLFPHAQTFLISTCTIINHAQHERTGARICFPVVDSKQPRSAFCLVSVPGVCLFQCTHCNLRLKRSLGFAGSDAQAPICHITMVLLPS